MLVPSLRGTTFVKAAELPAAQTNKIMRAAQMASHAKKWGWRGQPRDAAMTFPMYTNFLKQVVTGDYLGAGESMADDLRMRQQGGIAAIKARDEYRRLNPPPNQRPSIGDVGKSVLNAGVNAAKNKLKPSGMVMPWSSDASWNPRDTIRGWKNHIFGK